MDGGTYEEITLLGRQEMLSKQILQQFEKMTDEEICETRKQFIAENPCLSKKARSFIDSVVKSAIMRTNR